MTVELSIGKITCTKETLFNLTSIMAIYAVAMEDDDCKAFADRVWGDFHKLMTAKREQED